MRALQEIDAPAQLSSEGIGESLIGLRIIVPPNPAVLFLTPPANCFATYTLCRLLRLALEAAGIRVTEATSSLAFNRSYYLFGISKLGPGLEILKDELKNLAVLDWSQIAWRDAREGVWRLWPAQTGAFDVPSDAELDAEGDFLGRITEALNDRKKI